MSLLSDRSSSCAQRSVVAGSIVFCRVYSLALALRAALQAFTALRLCRPGGRFAGFRPVDGLPGLAPAGELLSLIRWRSPYGPAYGCCSLWSLAQKKVTKENRPVSVRMPLASVIDVAGHGCGCASALLALRGVLPRIPTPMTLARRTSNGRKSKAKLPHPALRATFSQREKG